MALFFGLLSASYGLLQNKRMGFAKSSPVRWYLLLYITTKAIEYAIYCAPIEVIFTQFTYDLVAKVTAILGCGFLLGATFGISKGRDTPSLTHISFLTGVVVLTGCTWFVGTALTCQCAGGIELILSCIGALELTRLKKIPFIVNGDKLRYIAVLWVIFSILDPINRLIPVSTVSEGLPRLIGYIAGICTLAAITINIREISSPRRAPIDAENKHRVSITLIGWICVGIVTVLSMFIADNLTRQYYKSKVEDTRRTADLMLSRLKTWQEQDEVLMRATGESPLILELLSSKGSHDLKGANLAIDRCAYGIKDSVCLIVDSTGKCIASSNRYINHNYIGRDFSKEGFFRRVMQDSACTEYKSDAIKDIPAAYTAYPVHDKETYEVVGAIILEKALSAEKLFINYPHAFLLGPAPENSIIQATDRNLLGIKESQLRSQNGVPFVGIGGSARGDIIRLENNLYFLAITKATPEGCGAGILRDATEFFVYRAIADILVALSVAITIAIFSFLRYVAERTEYELTQAREFKNILDCSPNCVVLLDSAMNCYHVYGPTQLHLGISEPELVGKSFLELWPVEQKIMVRDKIKDILLGHSASFESRYMAPDGHTKYLYAYCGPLFNSSGSADRVIAVLVDITQRKRIEQELLGRLDLERTLSTITQEFLSENLIEENLQKSLWHLLQFCKQDRVSWFEFKAEEPGVARCLYKHDSETLLPDQIIGFYPKISFEGPMKVHLQALQDKKHVILSRDTHPEAHTFLASQYIQSCLFIPIFLGKQLAGLLRVDCCQEKKTCRADDINRIKMVADLLQENLERARDEQMRKLLDAAVQSTHDAIIIYDQADSPENPRVAYVNPATLRMFGYSREEIIGVSPTIFYADKSNDRPPSIMDTIARSREFHGEAINKRKDGSEFTAEISVSPIVDSRGTVTHCISVRRDVTEQREVQRRSSLSNKLESIGQLAAGIAHEINSPAQFISDNLHFLKDAFKKFQADLPVETLPIPDERKSVFTRLSREIPEAIADGLEGVQRIATIVQAMREFSHSSAEKARADLNKAIATTVTVARNEWKYYADVKMEFAPDLPMVLCHIGDINQVILNLVVNSAHAIKERFGSGEKKGIITIRTYAEGSNVKIEVGDNGNGIPDNIKDKVYDPFFTTKPQGQGTGQGLYLSHRIIVDRHKGSIGFTSTAGVGTKFTVTLPIG